MWQLEIMNVNTPISLQRAVFFYVGKMCCLRGGEEQRMLKISQFHCSYDPDVYTYVENGSKNLSGGLAQLNLVVPIYSVPEHQPRCLVYLLDLYFSKVPSFARDKDVFTYGLKKCPSLPHEASYDAVPVGKNKLATVIRVIHCARVELHLVLVEVLFSRMYRR